MLLDLLRRLRPPPAAACDPLSEITFDIRVRGYGNDSHGSTCCQCGGQLPAVEYDDSQHGYLPKHPDIGQIELHFSRQCPHGTRHMKRWGGYVCSSICALRVQDWLLGAPSEWDICPGQHRAQNLQEASPPAPASRGTG